MNHNLKPLVFCIGSLCAHLKRRRYTDLISRSQDKYELYITLFVGLQSLNRGISLLNLFTKSIHPRKKEKFVKENDNGFEVKPKVLKILELKLKEIVNCWDNSVKM